MLTKNTTAVNKLQVVKKYIFNKYIFLNLAVCNFSRLRDKYCWFFKGVEYCGYVAATVSLKLIEIINILYDIYTPGIYADGYIVFAFPFVCSLVRSLVRSLFRNVRGIYVKVFVKVSLVVYIS